MDGGAYLHITAGAVPNAVNGEVVSVPPEIFVLWPAPDRAELFQVVVSVSTVEAAFLAAVTIMVSPVYGLTSSFN